MKKLLKEDNNIEISGEAGNHQEVLSSLASSLPDIVLLDISMPGRSGLDTLKEITTHYPKTKEEGLADFQSNMAGKVLTVEFELSGNRFLAINAGPTFKFNEAVSFAVPCEDQQEIDYYWEKLSAVPESEQCGWLKDKFGLSWQIVPRGMDEMLGSGKDPVAAKRAMEAVMKMVKFDIKALKDAYEGK